MKKCTCDTEQKLVYCREVCDADVEKRHPSEITLDEFIEVAKIINPMSFNNRRKWEMIDTANEGVENSYRLTSKTSRHHFHIDWDNELSFDYYDGALHDELKHPSFQQSLKIAAYLDQIGIEYRPKED